MPLTLDFDDWDVFDRTVATLTYSVYDPSGSPTEYEDVSGLRLAIDHVPVYGEAAGMAKRVTWHLRRSTLPGVTPAMGDRITEADGTQWIVVENVSKQTDDVRWRCVCQRLGGAG